MDSLYPKTKWFNVIHRPESKAVKPKIQLFCFPFAGTSPYMFNIRWAKSLPLSCQVIGVAYPGRGVRIEETSFTSVTKLVDNLLRDTRECYGAACAYEMARRLQLEHLALPKHLICSGHLPMHFNPFLPCIGRLPDDELQEEMLKRYGSPIITDPKIKKIALPPLRADIIAVEQYKSAPFTSIDTPLKFPLTVITGENDKMVPVEKMNEWSIHSNGMFSIKVIPNAGHFYVDHPEMIKHISDAIANYLIVQNEIESKSEKIEEKKAKFTSKPKIEIRYLSESPINLKAKKGKFLLHFPKRFLILFFVILLISFIFFHWIS